MSAQPRRALRTDDNQVEIIRALRKCGVAVEVIGQPVDLLCCVRGVLHLVEVKAQGGSLTKAQVEFIARWPSQIHIVRSPEEAIACLIPNF